MIEAFMFNFLCFLSVVIRVGCAWIGDTTTECLITAAALTNGIETTEGGKYHRRLMACGALS
jgi:hypothetical protein